MQDWVLGIMKDLKDAADDKEYFEMRAEMEAQEKASTQLEMSNIFNYEEGEELQE